jgi:hypothetical protein
MVLWVEMKLDFPPRGDDQGIWIECEAIFADINFMDGPGARCRRRRRRRAGRRTRSHASINRGSGIDKRQSYQD